MPVIVSNFIACQTMYEKRVTKFLKTHFWILAPLGTPWNWCTARSVRSMCQISSRSDNLCKRYLLPNFIDFVDSVTDKQTYKHTNKLEQKDVLPNINRTQAPEIPPAATEWSCLLLNDVICSERVPFRRCRGDGSAQRVFVCGDLGLWPLTLTFKIFRARDQACLPCEFGANPFSGSRAIWFMNKQTKPKTNKKVTGPKTEPYAVHCVRQKTVNDESPHSIRRQ